jgi:sarcosine oxidase
VLGLEQFELGHARGASQDHSRIVRLSYHTPGYVRLAQEAYQAWSILEAEAKTRVVLKTGGLDFAPRVGRIPLDDYINSLDAVGVPFEHLDAGEIMRRWPPFRLTDDVHGLYQSESGLASPNQGNAAHWRMARAYGATLRDRAPVTSLRALNGEVEVALADGPAYRCAKLIIAADAWTNTLLAHFGMHLPLTVTEEQVTYFASPRLSDFMPDRFPIWIWMDEPCFYGFPVYGEAGPKAAQDVGGDEVTADTRTFEPNPAAHQRLVDFLAQYLPDMLGPVIYTKTCLYTLPPDRDFVLDSLPEHPNIFVALGAAHGYKFAALFGKILSELALDGSTPSDISPFKIDRPILKMENPPKHFMV